MAMYRGNFDISATIWWSARRWRSSASTARCCIFAATPAARCWLTLELQGDDAAATLHVRYADPRLNRFWFRICAEPREHVWGCGEQLSYFDLRGRRFPLWTSEPGVGRDKTSPITFQADVQGHAGGDYYTTNYPQPSFISSRRYAAHVETTAYSAFDFRHDAFHELEVWAAPQRLEFHAAADFPALVERVVRPLRPPAASAGLALQRRHHRPEGRRRQLRPAWKPTSPPARASPRCGARTGPGVRTTSFGTRLFWDWRWNPARYPDLPQRIADLRARGIRFMGYANPYLCADGALFGEAESRGLLARNAAGRNLSRGFRRIRLRRRRFHQPGGARLVRRAHPVRQHAGSRPVRLDGGFRRVPADRRAPRQRRDAKLMHNAWPTIWAEVNADAIARAGRSGDALFFMRAGFTGVQRFCPLLWAGDQCVDFSRHDGLPSVICGALSSGLLGNAYHHSDIGGYTSLFGNVRTPELLQRWTEMAAFTPVMRTHEGNRPRDNLQIDQSPEVLAHFARFTRIWCHLAPYLRALSDAGRDARPAAATSVVPGFPDDPGRLYGPGPVSLRPRSAGGAGARGGINGLVRPPAGRRGLDPCVERNDLPRRRARHGAGADRPAAGVLSRGLGHGRRCSGRCAMSA